MEKDLSSFLCLLSQDQNTYYSFPPDTNESTVSLLMASDVSRYKRAQASIQMAALNLRPHSHQYIDVQACGPISRLAGWTRLRHYIASSLPATVHITLYYLPENVVHRNDNVRRDLTYDDTVYGVTLYLQRLYKLVIWYNEIYIQLQSPGLLRECTPICLSNRFIRVNQILFIRYSVHEERERESYINIFDSYMSIVQYFESLFHSDKFQNRYIV